MSARRWARSSLGLGGLVAALVLAACQPPSTMPPLPGKLELGTIDPRRFGDNRWVALAEGEEVELASGAQGGFHVWVKYRITGLGGRVRVNRIAERIGSDGTRQRVLTAPSTVIDLGTLAAEGVTYWESADPIPSFMCPTPIGVSVLDAPIQLDVSVESAEPVGAPGAALARATVTLRPHCPPLGDTTRDFCLQICQG